MSSDDPRSGSKQRRPLTWISSYDKDSRRRVKSHTSTENKRLKTTARIRIAQLKDPSNRRILIPAPAAAPKPNSASQIPSPVSPLGAGRVDPFASYPISLKSDQHLDLVDHFLVTAPSLASKPQKRVCFLPLFQRVRQTAFEIAQNDPAAFSVILAISAADRSMLRENEIHPAAIRYSTHSIRLLRERIVDEGDAVGDGSIATIALLVVYQVLFESCDALEKHTDALETLVNLRGGMDVIESSNPGLALLIDLADYLPPVSALVGRRRFASHSSPEGETPKIISPVAKLAPRGLGALAMFDVYLDLKQLCTVLHRATRAVCAGDMITFSVTENKIRSLLQDLLALGTSNLAWGRRCEILVFVHLAALIYLEMVSRAENDGGVTVAVHATLLASLPASIGRLGGHVQGLLQQLYVVGDLDDVVLAVNLAPLMEYGASMSGPAWVSCRQRVQALYEDSYRKRILSNSRRGSDPQDLDISGLTALFGFFGFQHP